ncbi:MAG: hypothetical protein AB7N29_16955 [Vicinamibacterales bacterium]
MNREPLGAIQEAAEDSYLWRAVQAAGDAWSAAWATSRVGRLAALATARVQSATPAHRLRVAATVVAWACAWHVAGLYVLPRYVTSGLPRLWFVAAALFAVLTAVFAEALVRAWGASALRRALRRLATPGAET